MMNPSGYLGIVLAGFFISGPLAVSAKPSAHQMVFHCTSISKSDVTKPHLRVMQVNESLIAWTPVKPKQFAVFKKVTSGPGVIGGVHDYEPTKTAKEPFFRKGGFSVSRLRVRTPSPESPFVDAIEIEYRKPQSRSWTRHYDCRRVIVEADPQPRD